MGKETLLSCTFTIAMSSGGVRAQQGRGDFGDGTVCEADRGWVAVEVEELERRLGVLGVPG